MDDTPIVKTLTLTAMNPHEMANRLLTFQRALHKRAGTLMEVRWKGTHGEQCEASITYGLPLPAPMAC